VTDKSASYHARMDRGLTARQLVEGLGPTLLRLVADRPAADRPLTGVVIHDPAAAGDLEPGSVVLGVGIGTRAELVALADAMVAAGANVLAVKGPLGRYAHACAVPVIEINPGASWMHLAATIRERMLDHARAQVQPQGGGAGELFTIANTISDLLRAPVTIEDRSSAVLAWSAGQDEADAARVETILGRAVDRRWLEELGARGDFARLHASAGPVYLEPVAPGMLARVAIAIRAGADVLGYVWAAVREPLDEQQARELEQIAPIVALHLVSTRAGTTRARQQRRELAAAVLGGGAADAELAQQVHLGPGPICVLAAGARDPGPGGAHPSRDDAVRAAELRRFEDALDLYLAAVHPSAITVSSNLVVYALVGWPRGTSRDALASSCALARDFLGRSPMGGDYVIAVGGPAGSLEHIVRARTQADAALRALRRTSDTGTAVGTLDNTALPVLLLQLADVAASMGMPASTGPLRRLVEHDGEHGILAATLAAYLDASCVAEVAATALRVHVNTMRYRLRRIREISGLDFGDADAMLLAHLQLRVNALRGVDGNNNQAH
jgi:hypothetical protein